LAKLFAPLFFFENKSPSTKSCEKIPGRLDIFVKELSEAAQKARKREYFKNLIPFGIIILFAGLGYKIFGNEPGFIAMAVIGVALAELIRVIIVMR